MFTAVNKGVLLYPIVDGCFFPALRDPESVVRVPRCSSSLFWILSPCSVEQGLCTSVLYTTEYTVQSLNTGGFESTRLTEQCPKL
jgi:hypothetical protein